MTSSFFGLLRFCEALLLCGDFNVTPKTGLCRFTPGFGVLENSFFRCRGGSVTVLSFKGDGSGQCAGDKNRDFLVAGFDGVFDGVTCKPCTRFSPLICCWNSLSNTLVQSPQI